MCMTGPVGLVHSKELGMVVSYHFCAGNWTPVLTSALIDEYLTILVGCVKLVVGCLVGFSAATRDGTSGAVLCTSMQAYSRVSVG